jgi:hypothetical protein
MKILRSKNQKKSVLYAIAVILLLGLIGLAFSYAFHIYPFNKNQSSTDLSPATNDQKEAGEDIKRSNNTPTNSAKNDSDQVSTPPSPTNSGKQNIPVTITSTNQDTEGNLNIRAIVNTLEKDNSCILTITHQGQEVYSETVTTFAQSSYTSCGGFMVEKAKLNGTTGPVTVTIKYTGPAYEGTASQEVSIK